MPQIVIALVLAALLDTHLRGRTLWRMSILLPFVVAPVAVAIIFGSLFGDHYGLDQRGRSAASASTPIRWHTDRFASHVAIATMVNWRWTGYNALIFLAAMQAVPRDLYESAALDGAGRVRQFVSVTLPMIRPTMIFVIITSTIGGLQIFAEPRLFDDTTAPQRRRRPPVRHHHDAHLRLRLAAARPRPRLGHRLAAVPDHRRVRAVNLAGSSAASAACGGGR